MEPFFFSYGGDYLKILNTTPICGYDFICWGQVCFNLAMLYDVTCPYIIIITYHSFPLGFFPLINAQRNQLHSVHGSIANYSAGIISLSAALNSPSYKLR